MAESTPNTPKLKKKQSWMGSIIRSAIAHGALTAKAAVDAVRERIDGHPPAPQAEQRTESPAVSPTHATPKIKHKKSQSVQSTLSSIRARLPRRSLDRRHHSISDLFRSGSSNSGREGQEYIHISPKRKRLAALAAQVPLPSSPIDVPGKAPSLSLDFRPRELMSPTPIADEQELTSPKSTNTDITSLRLPTPMVQRQETIADLLPDPAQPVAEVRPVSIMHADDSALRCENNWPMLESPLPGTNTRLELGNSTPTDRAASQEKTFLVIADISEPACKDTSTRTTFLQKLERVTSAPDYDVRDIAILDTAKVLKLPTSTSSVEAIANSGPPSPDRSVGLALRPKPSIDSVLRLPSLHTTGSYRDGLHQKYQSNASTPSKSSSSPRRPGPSRPRRSPQSIQDMTVSVLRERTDDHLQHLDGLIATTDAKLRGNDVSPISQAGRGKLLQQSSSSPGLTIAREAESDGPGFHSAGHTPASAGQVPRPSPVSDEDSLPCPYLSGSSSRELLVDAFTHRLRMASSSPSPLRQHMIASRNRFSPLADLSDSDSDISLPFYANHY